MERFMKFLEMIEGTPDYIQLKKDWIEKAYETWNNFSPKLFQELFSIFCRKQDGYGPNNIADTRELGVAIRLNDKVKRILNLLKNGTNPDEESIRDNLLDIADYAIIALLCLDGNWPEYVDEDYPTG